MANQRTAQAFTLDQCRLTGGFWQARQTLNDEATLLSVYREFSETGRFRALKCEESPTRAHVYWDSDVAKWLEGAAYSLARRDNPEIRAHYDEAVEDIVRNQLPTGYFNSYFQVYEPEAIFTRQEEHELYCAGHLFEAAVAASEYLHDDRLLHVAERYAAYIYERFMVRKDTGFSVPGHEEIELALFRLYALTGRELYREMAFYFLNTRGTGNNPPSEARRQNHRPLREQTEAVGHAVRALYLYAAMADMAMMGDEGMEKAVRTLASDLLDRKMYVTGGIGSTCAGEAVSSAYNLPNYNAYSETCAAIALVFFCHRMLCLTGEARYGDAIERALFNGVLAGESLDGRRFFYVNPLEMQLTRTRYHLTTPIARESVPLAERVSGFGCSCCPPNLCRFLGELSAYVFYRSEDGQTLTVSQYMTAELHADGMDVTMESDFPYSGRVSVRVNSHGRDVTLRFRKPAWCRSGPESTTDGWIIRRGVFDGEPIELDFPMELQAIAPSPLIPEAGGKIAFGYGPLILCAEGVDQAFPLFGAHLSHYPQGTDDPDFRVRVRRDSPYVLEAFAPVLCRRPTEPLYSYGTPVEEAGELRLIPYFAWANRGENDMRVWIP